MAKYTHQDRRSPNKTLTSGNALIPELQTLLGACVLIPVPRGRKSPVLHGWQKKTLADMENSNYLHGFNGGNIGVLLGKPSRGLCSIDIDDDTQVAPFLELNSVLKETLRTKRARGCNLWLRINGEYPRLNKLKTVEGADWGEWRATGGQTILWGEADGVEYQRLHEAHPVEIQFEDIVWPQDLVLPWATKVPPAESTGVDDDTVFRELKQKFGEPYYLNSQKVIGSINERFWAGLYYCENEVLFDPDERHFYQYHNETGLWKPITEVFIRESISDRILETTRQINQFELQMQITKRKLDGALVALRGICEKRQPFQHEARFIHAKNGVIRFTKDNDVRFGPFSPEDYSRNQCPIDFKDTAQCPRFLNELVLPAMPQEDVDLLQRWVGLAIFGYNLPQRFIILEGMPGGGKGTIVRVVQRLVGIENCYQLRTEVLHERFELFRYRSKTLLIGPDVPGNFLMSRGAYMIKPLVGGDPLSAEGKGSNADFPIYGVFNIVITCNSRLRVSLDGDTGAWRRRLLIIPFKGTPAKRRIPDFEKMLLDKEGPGILRWALQGFTKLQQELQEIGDFRLTPIQQERIDGLLAESDSLRIFMIHKIQKNEGDDVTNSEIIQAYVQFCSDRRWAPRPITIIERQLTDLMLELFHAPKSKSIERDGKRNKRGWRNVGFK